MDRKPYLYQLRDNLGKHAKRLYYARELRPLAKKPLKGNVPLAGVLAKRMKKGKEEWLARFVDFEKKYGVQNFWLKKIFIFLAFTFCPVLLTLRLFFYIKIKG
ncbi:MAG: hypothetical protein F6J92_39295, partial [Symploca sp. SIO1A3]|nr:hypothetical protein [Symploca sp. SIO1A3]